MTFKQCFVHYDGHTWTQAHLYDAVYICSAVKPYIMLFCTVDEPLKRRKSGFAEAFTSQAQRQSYWFSRCTLECYVEAGVEH